MTGSELGLVTVVYSAQKGFVGVEPLSNLYALPIYLGRILPPGLIGIVSAGMIAAFMSTHDSYLLCWREQAPSSVSDPSRI